MAYYRKRNRPGDAQNAPSPQYPGPFDIWNTIKAPLEGFVQGLAGKNLTWEQFKRTKRDSKRGLAPGQYPGRGPINWLGRAITGKS